MGKGSDELRNVTKEINKIVSAPYPVLFKALAYTLSRVDDNHVYLWAIVKSCQVQALVTRLISSLNKDEDAQPVLLRLLQNATVRDEVVKQDPKLLLELLEIASERNVFEACVAICQSPSFENATLLMQFANYAESVLANARNEAIDVWICRADAIMSNLSLATLSTADHNTIRKCIGLWSEASKSAESLTFIRFASIASKVHHMRADDESCFSYDLTASDTPDPVDSWITRCSSFFTNPKAYKMLKSLLLHSLQIVSDKNVAEKDSTISALATVRTVLETFPKDVLQTMLEDREAIQIVMKLVQKSTLEHIPSTMRLAIAGILLTLDSECQFWDVNFLHISFTAVVLSVLEPPRTDKLRRRLYAAKNLKFRLEHQSLWQCLLGQCLNEESILRDTLQYLIDWCRPGISATPETVICLHSASSLATDICQYEIDTDSKGDVSSSITAVEIPEWWNWDLRASFSNASVNCCSLEVCPHVSKSIQNSLAGYISRFVVRSSCTSAVQISRAKFEILFDVINRQTFVGEPMLCRWPAASEQQTVWPEDRRSSYRNLSESDAKEQLTEKLESMKEQTANAVWEHIDRVCRDLQHRCQSIEVPLRTERARCEELQKDLTETRNATELMVADHRARSLRWQHDLEVEHQKVQALEASQADLEHSLALTKNQLEEEVQRHHTTQKNNLDLNGRISEIQTEVEQRTLELEETRAENIQRTSDNVVLKQRLREAQDKEQQLLRVLHGEWNQCA